MDEYNDICRLSVGFRSHDRTPNLFAPLGGGGSVWRKGEKGNSSNTKHVQGISLKLIVKLVLKVFDQLLKFSSQWHVLIALGEILIFICSYAFNPHDRTLKINTMKSCAHTVHLFLCLELLVNFYWSCQQ